jgi:hypothetical protein
VAACLIAAAFLYTQQAGPPSSQEVALQAPPISPSLPTTAKTEVASPAAEEPTGPLPIWAKAAATPPSAPSLAAPMSAATTAASTPASAAPDSRRLTCLRHGQLRTRNLPRPRQLPPERLLRTASLASGSQAVIPQSREGNAIDAAH